jgi:PAS domain S-box-containing protein
MSDAKTILIVDDSESDRLLFRRYIRKHTENSYRVLEAETIHQGIELWRSHQPDVTLVDFNLTDGNGLAFLEAIQANSQANSKNVSLDRKLPVIMLTGYEDARTAVSAMKLGASDYLVKSDISEFSLVQTIQSLLDRIELSLQLERSQQRERLVSQISLNISQFLNLEQICQTITQEICEFLQADRTLIYKFDQDMRRRIISEALVSPWSSCLNFMTEDGCFDLAETQIKEYQEGKILIANDVRLANFSECHIQMLESFQIRANVVVPIVISEPLSDALNAHQPADQPLWGLLIVHQCSAPRHWQEHEILLLQQLSVQLAIAIQQAEIHQNAQALNTSLERQVQERTSELRASEEKTRSILNSLPDLINLFDADGNYIESILNNIAYDLVPPHIDRFGTNIADFLPEEIATRQIEAMQQAVLTGEVQTFEQTFEIENEVHYEEVRVVPYQEDNVIILVRDVSDRKQAEADLLASESRFQKIALSSPGAIQILIQGVDGLAYFEYMSAAFEEINELSIEQVLHNPQIYFDQIHIDDLANFWESLGASLEDSSNCRYEWRIITPSHQVKWLKANLRPERRDNGDVAWYGFVSDISDRKYAELELQQQYQRTQILTEVTLKIRQSLNI